MSDSGFIEIASKLKIEPGSTLTFRINHDNGIIETVEKPTNPELNIIIKPFTRIDSTVGQAILSSIGKSE